MGLIHQILHEWGELGANLMNQSNHCYYGLGRPDVTFNCAPPDGGWFSHRSQTTLLQVTRAYHLTIIITIVTSAGIHSVSRAPSQPLYVHDGMTILANLSIITVKARAHTSFHYGWLRLEAVIEPFLLGCDLAIADSNNSPYPSTLHLAKMLHFGSMVVHY